MGKISNGAIILPPDIHLPEGMELEVTIPAKFSEIPEVKVESVNKGKTLYERFEDFIGMADDLPCDLAQNHDHYLHGHPKK
ncbi:MAG: hypothetical protein M3Y82_10395 [Verrucomicrobiota bacterium]|nr:hypothetical protein [Verrucomicrobiota bacterium]